MSEEYKEEEYFEPMTEVDVYGVILEVHNYPRDTVSKERRKVTPQQLNSTTASRKKRMVANSNQKINDHQFYRLNNTRIKLKGLDTGNQNPNMDSRKLAQMWGIGI